MNFVRRSLFLLKGFLSNVRITDVWFLGTWENGRGREVDMIFSRLWGFADLYAYLPRSFFSLFLLAVLFLDRFSLLRCFCPIERSHA